MATTLAEQVAVEKVSENEYVSKFLPMAMGNSLPVAYGGCALAVAVSAAIDTIPAGLNLSLYSVLGHYLGPATTKQKLTCRVTRTRDTRSFATRRVEVSQVQKDGSSRVCMELLADFHRVEASTTEYSASPTMAYPRVEDCPDFPQAIESARKTGRYSEAEIANFLALFGAGQDFVEMKACPNGVGGQKLSGAAKNLATTQDGLPSTERTSAEWNRARHALPGGAAANMAALAYIMDGGLSFTPLTHGRLWFEDAEAVASLDFALRFFVPEIDIANDWYLRERMTSRGGSGRTYSEGRLWDDKGNLVASMTQQSILRLRKDAPKPAL